MGLYYADGKGNAIPVANVYYADGKGNAIPLSSKISKKDIFSNITSLLMNEIINGSGGAATGELTAGTIIVDNSNKMISVEDFDVKLKSILKTDNKTVSKAEVIQILTDNYFDTMYTLYNDSTHKLCTKTDFSDDGKTANSLVGSTVSVNRARIDDSFAITDSTGKDVSGGTLGQDVKLVWYVSKSNQFKLSTSDSLPKLYSGNGGPA